MEALLRVVMPRVIGTVHCNFQRFGGKQALLRQLPRRLRALRRMVHPGWLILVVVDRDRDDCRHLKERLEAEARAVGLATRTSHPPARVAIINRIVIEELEAWYFGDWSAVTAAYPRVSTNIPTRAAYRIPDAITGGTWEAFQRIMNASGYYPTGIPKIEVAQRIAPHMDPARNTSRSFRVFRDALLEAATP